MQKEDIEYLVTALADLINGYHPKDLADGWREAAARIVNHLRLTCDDDGAWDVLAD